MVSFKGHHHQGDEEDLAEAVEAVEEVIASVGVKRFIAACLRTPAGEHFDKFGGNATLKVAQTILSQIVYAKDARLEARIMAIGAGIILRSDETMTRMAAEHGLTKQAISKRVLKFCDKNNLPPSAFMRNPKDRKTYALTNQPRIS